jgi:hypothetical protein
MPDAPELAVALEYMDELGSPEQTRLVSVYGLSGLIANRPATCATLTESDDFGQFEPHIKEAEPLLPAPVVIIEGVTVGLPGQTLNMGPVRVSLLVTPRADAALVLDGFLPLDVAGQAVAKVLELTCLQRKDLLLDGKPALDWLRARPEAAGLTLPTDLAFGRNVHQCVFPGGRLLAAIRAGERYWRIINRVAAPEEPQLPVIIAGPAELNYESVTAVGHGRGVSVVAGFSESVENIYALIAVMLVTGLSVLHRSRANLFEAMDRASRSSATTTKDARDLIAYLSAQLNDLQLDLEFGVESYLDSVLIPEFIVDSFQRSLCETMGLRSGLEHSSRMLERLSSVIQAKGLALDAAFQEQSEHRDQLFSGVLAIGTLLAVPPALLLAYFALGAGGSKALDLNTHTGPYLLAWIPFIALICVAWVWRHQIKAHSPQLEKYEQERPAGAEIGPADQPAIGPAVSGSAS